MNTDKLADESRMEVMVDAALSGHDLTVWEYDDKRSTPGWQARCRRCDRTVWVGAQGLIYSLLDESCTD